MEIILFLEDYKEIYIYILLHRSSYSFIHKISLQLLLSNLQTTWNLTKDVSDAICNIIAETKLAFRMAESKIAQLLRYLTLFE